MGKLSKEGREKRNNWNRERLVKNAGIGTLSETQHTALAILCHYRHKMHVASERFYDRTMDADKARRFFEGPANIMLEKAGLPKLGCDLSFDIPDVSRMEGMEDDLKRLAKYSCTIYVQKLNREVEDYLRMIDETYGTWYTPSGFTRLAS